MDEAHLAAALRQVSLNPVRADFVSRPRDWR
jgi:putative transposase